MTSPIDIDLQGEPPTEAAFKTLLDLAALDASKQDRQDRTAMQALWIALGAGALLGAAHLFMAEMNISSWVSYAIVALMTLTAFGLMFYFKQVSQRDMALTYLFRLRVAYSEIDGDTAAAILPIVKSEPVAKAYVQAATAQGRALVMAEAQAIRQWPAERERREALIKLRPEGLLAQMTQMSRAGQ